MILADGRYLFLSFSEPRAIENVHDSSKNVRCVYDDPRGSLRQRQSFPQQHSRGGRRPVHQRSAELTGFGGEWNRKNSPVPIPKFIFNYIIIDEIGT
jgi:hypothetical protein